MCVCMCVCVLYIDICVCVCVCVFYILYSLQSSHVLEDQSVLFKFNATSSEDY